MAKKVAISAKPTKKPQSVSKPSVKDGAAVVTWKIPDGAFSTSSKSRWDKVVSSIVFHCKKNGKDCKVKTFQRYKDNTKPASGGKKAEKSVTKYGDPNSAANGGFSKNKGKTLKVVFNSNYDPKRKTMSQGFNWKLFHPYVKDVKLAYIMGTVSARNAKGKLDVNGGKLEISAPAKPSVGSLSLNAETGYLSSTIKLPDNTVAKHRSYTDYIWEKCKDNSTWERLGGSASTKGWSSSTATEIATDREVVGYSALTSKDDRIYVRLRAIARGAGGDSESSASHVFAYPARGEVVKAYLDDEADLSVAMVHVKVQTNSTNDNPVDTAQLEYFTTTAALTVSQAGAQPDSEWNDVPNAVDDRNVEGWSHLANILGLLDENGNAAGKHVWYRLRTKHDTYQQVSPPFEAESLYFPVKPEAVSTDECEILSAESLVDGTGVRLTVGFRANDGSDHTVISWDTDEESWRSTKEPSSHSFEWYDTLTGHEQWTASAEIIVKDLTESTKYYFKARRENQSTDSHGAWSNTVTATPVSTPYSATLYAPEYVRRGSDLPLSWTYSSYAEQTAWSLYLKSPDPEEGEDADPDTAIATGESSITSTVISSDVIGEAESLDLYVSVSTGGPYKSSDVVTVAVADKPSCQLAIQPVLTEQPLRLYLRADQPDLDALVKVYSQYIPFQAPDGDASQIAGDVVTSLFTTPRWKPDGSSYFAEIILEDGLAFLDGGYYDVVAFVSDEHSVISEAARATFQVDWAHQAEMPGTGTRAVGVPGTRSARITLAAPEGAADTDVCDIYRVTRDGVYRVISGVPFGSMVTDRFAPYSKTVDLFYRVATRTVDGDIAWRDIQYNVTDYNLRFDWGTGEEDFVELPYNLNISDAFTKDFEQRRHLDGSLTGLWNEGVARVGTLDTQLIRLSDAEQHRLVAELANHVGPVFVRTPNGSAYCANVDVGNLDYNYDVLTSAASFTATEIDLVDKYRVDPDRDVERPAIPAVDPVVVQEELLYWGKTAPAVGTEYGVMEEPSDLSVTLQVSEDSYQLIYPLEATASGNTVTITAIPEDAAAVIERLAEDSNAEYLVRIEYETAAAEPEEGETVDAGA